MGIDWEWIFGDENSENFEDHFSSDYYDDHYDYDSDNEDYYDEEDAIPNGVDLGNIDLDKPLKELSDIEKNYLATSLGGVSYAMTQYIIAMLKGTKNAHKRDEFSDTWEDDAHEKHPIYGHLFHANSVSTSIDFIKKGFIYSRQYGESFRTGQTSQRSDSLDQVFGIYNDIFFDNSDIAYRLHKYNVYGPVVFVFDIDSLKDQDVRITKCNPIRLDPDKDSYRSLFFTSTDEIREAVVNESDNMAFFKDFGHHVTLFDTPAMDLAGNLKEIYIEKCYDGSGKENDLKDLITAELQNSGITGVNVVIRPDAPVPESDRRGMAAPVSEQWRFPE